MERVSTRRIVLNGLMIALVFLVTYLPFLHIPSPISQGYFNVGDSIVMITAIIFGRRAGMLAGALGSALADLVLGAFIFAPITLVVKGIEGYVVGLIATTGDRRSRGNIHRFIAVIAGVIVIVVGYFVFEATILKLIDDNFGYTAAIAELPGNLIQGSVSAVIAYLLSTILARTRIGNIAE